jgi:hypothetical protein
MERRGKKANKQCMSRIDERRTHSARLIGESDHNLPFPTPTRQLVPLLLRRTHIIEIGGEPDATHVNIVPHVVRDTIATTFGFVGAKVTLKRDLGVPGDVARISQTRISVGLQ